VVNQRNRFPARRRFLKQSAALSAGAAIPTAVVLAQSAAADPMRSLVGETPGGAADSNASADAAKTKAVGRPVTVDNRSADASGDVAAETAPRQPTEAARYAGETLDTAEDCAAGGSK